MFSPYSDARESLRLKLSLIEHLILYGDPDDNLW